MLVHIFQIIPVILFIASTSTDSLFKIPTAFAPELLILTSTATISYLLSFYIDTKISRYIFSFIFTLLYILLINKLYLTPSLGVLLTSIYIIILFKLRSYNFSHSIHPKYSIILPYFLCLILYCYHLFSLQSINSVLILATNLSFASMIYLIGLKTKFFKSFRTVAIVITILSTTLILTNNSIDLLKMSTNFWFITVTTLTFITIYKSKSIGVENLLGILFRTPEAVIISYFCILAAIGSFLLSLPISRNTGSEISFLDNLFTSISAVCVTGLIVLDTPNDFSLFGQSVILILIQLGGFGIVAISSWVIVGLQSKRLSIRHEQTLTEMSGHRPALGGMQSTLRQIVIYFLAFELVGALLLFWRFSQYDSSLSTAFWRGLFTSISAFCNAGFALQTDSLIPYQKDGWILMITSFLIIGGGFAPLMAIHLPKKIWKKRTTLQEKLVLTTTVALLLLGFTFFILVEWNHSLQHLGFFDKLNNAWFQSVTTRTAGFNSVDYTRLQEITPLFFLILMFIGGNPGGTAGGIKTVTFATIFLAGISGIRGEDHIRIFNRKIASRGVFKTMAIFAVGLCTAFIFFFMLAITQNLPITSILFETISALGTVGLSLGITSSLDEVGKVIIAICMLAGRVGPLAFILLLFRNTKTRNWGIPEEEIYIS